MDFFLPWEYLTLKLKIIKEIEKHFTPRMCSKYIVQVLPILHASRTPAINQPVVTFI